MVIWRRSARESLDNPKGFGQADNTRHAVTPPAILPYPLVLRPNWSFLTSPNTLFLTSQIPYFCHCGPDWCVIYWLSVQRVARFSNEWLPPH